MAETETDVLYMEVPINHLSIGVCAIGPPNPLNMVLTAVQWRTTRTSRPHPSTASPAQSGPAGDRTRQVQPSRQVPRPIVPRGGDGLELLDEGIFEVFSALQVHQLCLAFANCGTQHAKQSLKAAADCIFACIFQIISVFIPSTVVQADHQLQS